MHTFIIQRKENPVSFVLKMHYSCMQFEVFDGFDIAKWKKDKKYCPGCYGLRITAENIKKYGKYCLLTATPTKECCVILFENLADALTDMYHRAIDYKYGRIKEFSTFMCLVAFNTIEKCKILVKTTVNVKKTKMIKYGTM